MRFGDRTKKGSEEIILAYEGPRVIGFLRRFPPTRHDVSPWQVFKAGNHATNTPAKLLANVWPPKVFMALREVGDNDSAGGLTEAKATAKRLLA